MKKASIFGKYLLLERLNVGGMAEVFLAKSSAVVEGVERFIAIKKILPTMAEDEDFIRMFIDEARISVQLNHANIVHIHELGRADDTYFIAMEYVAGKDVRTILEQYRKRKQIMPTAQAVFIASKMCEALDYAHRKKDARGQDLGIIHRDVSPQNILVSYEGEVKIIDFGIAKAANRSQKTQAGILKGKFGYMSPEQVRGQPIDRRSDIFAVGVLLYEMITGEKLFTGESDYSVLEKVRNAVVPAPRQFNPNIPSGLERVLNKALAREPEQRYQWAGDLHEDLVRFLVEGDQIYTGKLLSSFMKDAFAAEIQREAASMERFSRAGGVEEGESVPPRRSTPAPTPATTEEFGMDEGEDGVDKTQLIDSSMVDAMAQVAADAPLPDATRADMVSPFLEDEKTATSPARAAAPSRPAGRSGPRSPVVIGGQAYGGATVVAAVDTPKDMPAVAARPVTNEATRIFDSPPEPANPDATRLTEAPSRRATVTDEIPEQTTELPDLEARYAELDRKRAQAAKAAEAEDDAEATAALDVSDSDGAPEDTDAGDAPEEPTNSEVAPTAAPIWMQRRVQLAAGGALALIMLIVLIAALGGKKSKGQAVVLKVLRPTGAKVLLDGQPVESGRVTVVAPGKHEAAFSAPGFVAQTRGFIAEANRPPLAIEISLQAERKSAPAPTASNTPKAPPVAPEQPKVDPEPTPASDTTPTTYAARFEAEEDGVEISVDGRSVGKTPEAQLDSLQFGKTYRYTAKLAGYKTVNSTFSSASDAELTVQVKLEKLPERSQPQPKSEPKVVSVVHHTSASTTVSASSGGSHRSNSHAKGWLACTSSPPGAEVIVDNRPTGRQTPVALSSPLSLSVGSHTVVFKMGSKKSAPRTVEINEKETSKLVNVLLE